LGPIQSKQSIRKLSLYPIPNVMLHITKIISEQHILILSHLIDMINIHLDHSQLNFLKVIEITSIFVPYSSKALCLSV